MSLFQIVGAVLILGGAAFAELFHGKSMAFQKVELSK